MAKPQAFRLLDLPAELRVRIYLAIALLPYDPLNLNIRLACHQTDAESSTTLFKHATWLLPYINGADFDNRLQRIPQGRLADINSIYTGASYFVYYHRATNMEPAKFNSLNLRHLVLTDLKISFGEEQYGKGSESYATAVQLAEGLTVASCLLDIMIAQKELASIEVLKIDVGDVPSDFQARMRFFLLACRWESRGLGCSQIFLGARSLPAVL
ncbi:hypothetical protein LTS18_003390 [Coniosporium uncinatum]|uniref:Uncharacterized protein n=1 Tax=Coniosporium uncinatum TaxID=93489 RepID=A0ACC3DZZ1_9PEZI|nr:hypothetical protein LTS18_003390 [Coniosporium uncinatum]